VQEVEKVVKMFSTNKIKELSYTQCLLIESRIKELRGETEETNNQIMKLMLKLNSEIDNIKSTIENINSKMDIKINMANSRLSFLEKNLILLVNILKEESNASEQSDQSI
jgi:glycine cleavage system regulatory protein